MPDAVHAAPPDKQPRTPRDPWLDNARFGLIALVVFGHLLEPLLAHHPLLMASYRFIHVFHMPAFAFLSGSVSSTTPDGHLVRATVFRLLLPYLIFQGLYALAAQWRLWPDPGPDGIITPYWLLWYLISLACWRLLLPLFARLRAPVWIALAIALAAGCSSDIGYFLSLSRTPVFFPVFVLGWQHSQCVRMRCQGSNARRLAVAALLALFGAAAASDLDPRWLYGSYSYAALHASLLAGAALRLLLLGCSIAGTCAYLTLVPRRRAALSMLGERSLGAYLLQGFPINAAIGLGAFAALRHLPRMLLPPVLLVSAAVLAAGFCTRGVQRMLAPITTPRWLERSLRRSASA